MFRSQSPLPALIAWCRALKYGLDAGLSPVKVFQQQAKSGPSVFREVAGKLAARMAAGESLSDALRPEAGRFPRMFVEMIAVGEQAGRLPDVFGELETHFEAVHSMRKKFIQSLVYPGIMYFGAILVITIMLFVMSMFGNKSNPIGLSATQFLFYAVVFTVFLFGTIRIIAGNANARAKVEAIALNIPGLSACVQAFALQRFAMAAHMTIEAGMKADRVLKHSLKATANGAYIAQIDFAAKTVRKGDEIHDALSGCGTRLFPEEFLNVVQVGEESGQLAEVMAKQAVYYREESIRKMKVVSSIVSGVVYMMVAMLIIVMIITIFKSIMGGYSDAMQGVDDPDKWLRGGK